MLYIVAKETGELVVTDGSGPYSSLSTAATRYGKELQITLENGVITDGLVYGDMCYIGDKNVEFMLLIPNYYPDKYEISAVIDPCSKFGAELVRREFGTFYMRTYNSLLIDELKEWGKLHAPEWKISLGERPKPEDAVLIEAEIEEATPFSLEKAMEQVRESFIENPKEDMGWDKPIPEQEISRPSPMDRYMHLLVPVECLGKTKACTDECVHIEDIDKPDDKWEQRGRYWILDCIPRGVRLIYSDKLDYYYEFKMSVVKDGDIWE